MPPQKNSLVHKELDLAKEFHPFKNPDVKLKELTTGSSKKIWWICPDCSYESPLKS